MLVLSRKSGESIQIGDAITVTVVQTRGNRVRLGIEAPDDIDIRREELAECRTQAEKHPTASEEQPRPACA